MGEEISLMRVTASTRRLRGAANNKVEDGENIAEKGSVDSAGNDSS